jgi:aspartate aminotransferase-like enzyme
MLQAEGLEQIFARHQRLCRATRAAVRAMGLTLLADDSCASPAITAVLAPPNLPVDKIRSHIKKHFDIVLAGGQDHLADKIFRIGHLGFVSDRDILSAISALESTLYSLGYREFPLGAGVTSVIQHLQ